MKDNSVTSSFERRTDPYQTLTNLTSIIVFSETRMQLTSQRHDGCGAVTETFTKTLNVVQTALICNVTSMEIWDSVRNQLVTRITLYLESARAELVHWTHEFEPTLAVQGCDARSEVPLLSVFKVYRRDDHNVERDYAAGIEPCMRWPAGLSKKQEGQSDLFANSAHPELLAVTPPPQCFCIRHTGPPPACHLLGWSSPPHERSF